MTWQKKELVKQIEQMERSVETDLQLGFGTAPDGAFDQVYQEIHKCQEELAHLRHYTSAEEMLYDTRGRDQSMDLPW